MSDEISDLRARLNARFKRTTPSPDAPVVSGPVNVAPKFDAETEAAIERELADPEFQRESEAFFAKLAQQPNVTIVNADNHDRHDPNVIDARLVSTSKRDQSALARMQNAGRVRPTYTPPPAPAPVREERLSLCERCGALLPDDDLMTIDDMLLCVECGDAHEQEQEQQAEERAERDARARDDAEALAQASVDPFTQVMREQVLPIMEAKAERDVDAVIELAKEASAVITAGTPEAQAQAVAILEPVRRDISAALASVYEGPTGVAQAASAIRDYLTYLKTQFVERDDIILAMAVVTIARMHLVAIGPPGTAKSLVARTYMKGITSVRKASYQGSAFTTIDELLGQISMRKLEDEDIYVRRLDGRMGAVELFELDETFNITNKANNTMLRGLNEREVFNPDTQTIPLSSCFGASNFYPNDPEIRALRDRYAVKLFVTYVSADGFKRMMRLRQDAEPRVTVDWSAFMRLIGECERLFDDERAIPERVMDLLAELRDHLATERVFMSDRIMRWSKSLLIARALLDGRTVVQPQDLWFLVHVLWDDVKDAPKVRAAIETLIGKTDSDLDEIITIATSVSEQFAKQIEAETSPAKRVEIRADALTKVDDLDERVALIGGGVVMEGETLAKYEAAKQAVKDLRAAVNPVRVQTRS